MTESTLNGSRTLSSRLVDILLRREPSRVRCSIRDDGSGFDIAAGNARNAPRGLGLLGMRERVNALGGTLAIESSPGHGTELRIDLPTEARHAAPNPAC